MDIEPGDSPRAARTPIHHAIVLATTLAVVLHAAHASAGTCPIGEACGSSGGPGIAGSSALAGSGGDPGAPPWNRGGDGGARSPDTGNPGEHGGNPAEPVDPAVDSGGAGGTFALQGIGGAGGVNAPSAAAGAGGEGSSVTVNIGAVGAGGGGGAGGGARNACLGGGGGGGGGGGYFAFGVDTPIGGGGGGGGGGGLGLLVNADATIPGGVRGGHGGDGGDGIVTFSSGTGGGGGGGGGCAARVMPGALLAVGADAVVAGGDGGRIVMAPLAAPGGSGGGGAAVVIGDATLVNAGIVAGGNGGRGRGSYFSGNGGIGILSTGGSTLITSGRVEGGRRDDDGVLTARAEAVTLRGGGNRLVLEPGAGFEGIVSSASAGGVPDRLVLGGEDDGYFDLSQVGAYVAGSSARFQGFGTFEKSGAGTWTLAGSGTPGAFGIAQAWHVASGSLVLESTLPPEGPGRDGALRIEDGAILAGTGESWPLTLEAGGTLSPGTAQAPYATLSIAGDAGLEPGSVLRIRSDGVGQCSRLAVDGEFAIGTALEVRFDAEPAVGMSCTIATSAARSGAFAAIEAGAIAVEVAYGATTTTIVVVEGEVDIVFADGFEAR